MKYLFYILAGLTLLGFVGTTPQLFAAQQRDGDQGWYFGNDEHNPWDAITGVAFSPDGKLLASSSRGITIRLWDTLTGKLLRELKWHAKGVYGVAFSPDGKLLASGSLDKTVRLWDTNDGKLQRTLKEPDYINCVAFSPDGKLLASGSSASETITGNTSGSDANTAQTSGHAVYVARSGTGNTKYRNTTAGTSDSISTVNQMGITQGSDPWTN